MKTIVLNKWYERNFSVDVIAAEAGVFAPTPRPNQTSFRFAQPLFHNCEPAFASARSATRDLSKGMN